MKFAEFRKAIFIVLSSVFVSALLLSVNAAFGSEPSETPPGNTVKPFFNGLRLTEEGMIDIEGSDEGEEGQVLTVISKGILGGKTGLVWLDPDEIPGFDGGKWAENPLDPTEIYYDGGNVGVKVSDPEYDLHVNGTTFSNRLFLKGGLLPVLSVVNNVGTPIEALWYSNLDNNFSWGQGGSWNYFADSISIGAPGMGQPASGISLDVDGDIKLRGEDLRDINDRARISFNTDKTNIASESNTLITLDGTNVGIGDTTPSYRLDVNGKIRSTNDVSADGNPVTQGDLYLYGKEIRSNSDLGVDPALFLDDYKAEINRYTIINGHLRASSIGDWIYQTPSSFNYTLSSAGGLTTSYYCPVGYRPVFCGAENQDTGAAPVQVTTYIDYDSGLSRFRCRLNARHTGDPGHTETDKFKPFALCFNPNN